MTEKSMELVRVYVEEHELTLHVHPSYENELNPADLHNKVLYDDNGIPVVICYYEPDENTEWLASLVNRL